MPKSIHKTNLLSVLSSNLCISESDYNAIGNVIYSMLSDDRISDVPENFLYKERPYSVVTLDHNVAGNRPKKGKNKTVAILPLTGFIEHKQSALGSFLGGTSTEGFGRMLDSAIGNPDVDALIIDIDSPGGTVIGVPELSDKIFKARKSGKPIIAFANPSSKSAAFWIGSAAEHFVAFPSGELGSVGAMTFRTDITQALENAGVKRTTIRATKSPFKAEGMSHEPFTEEAMASTQANIDTIMDDFIGHLGRNRGISTGKVEKNFGEGRVVSSKVAIESQMIDAVMTSDKLMGAVFNNKFRSGVKASDEDFESDWEVPQKDILAFATDMDDFSTFSKEPEEKQYHSDSVKRILGLRDRSLNT